MNVRIPMSPPMQFRITSSMSDAPTPNTPWMISTATLTEARLSMVTHVAARWRSHDA